MDETIIEVQPQVKISKPKKVSLRAIKAVQIVAKGGSKAVALRKAGFSPNTARTPKKVFNSKSFIEELNKFLPDSTLLRIHKEGLNATKNTYKNNNESGEVELVGEDPDFPTRHKYLETAYKIKGHMKTDTNTPSLQINMMNIRNKYA